MDTTPIGTIIVQATRNDAAMVTQRYPKVLSIVISGGL